MKDQTRKEPKILAAAEQRMRAWSLAEEITERSHPIRRLDPASLPLGNYITISREEGAGGSEIAELIGERLAWQVLDKNLVDRVADRWRLALGMLELLDEKKANWAYEIFGGWREPRIIAHSLYVIRLRQVILSAVRQGNAIIVGRGAQFMLPRDRGLTVRVIAPLEYRHEQIRKRHGLTAARARQFVAEADRGRGEFIRRFFHRDIIDPHFYDLVLNVEHLGPMTAAETIIAVYSRSYGTPALQARSSPPGTTETEPRFAIEPFRACCPAK